MEIYWFQRKECKLHSLMQSLSFLPVWYTSVPLLPFTLSLSQNVTCCWFSKWLYHFYHNRIERLWRDVWTAVTSTYYMMSCTVLKRRDYWMSQTRCTSFWCTLVRAGTITHSTQRETWPLSSCGPWACCKTAQMRLRMLMCTLSLQISLLNIHWFKQYILQYCTENLCLIKTAIWILGAARTWHRLGKCPLPWWVPARIWGCCCFPTPL